MINLCLFFTIYIHEDSESDGSSEEEEVPAALHEMVGAEAPEDSRPAVPINEDDQNASAAMDADMPDAAAAGSDFLDEDEKVEEKKASGIYTKTIQTIDDP